MAKADRRILITGGTGLIGSRLTAFLEGSGYEVNHLSRRASIEAGATHRYPWDLKTQTLLPDYLRNLHAIVHLAGENIAAKPWSEKQKRKILESRVQGTALLHKTLKKLPPADRPGTLIAASATGFYGAGRGDLLLTEESEPGSDFLATTAIAWEKELQKIADLGIRTVTLRTGLVLAREGGAFPKLLAPIRWYAGAPLGTGEQYISWIHIDDLCKLYIEAIEKPSYTGIYNAVAPEPVRNAQFVSIAAELLSRPLLLPPVPAWALRTVLGEMAELVLEGTRVSANKVVEGGFRFRYPRLKEAIKELLKGSR